MPRPRCTRGKDHGTPQASTRVECRSIVIHVYYSSSFPRHYVNVTLLYDYVEYCLFENVMYEKKKTSICAQHETYKFMSIYNRYKSCWCCTTIVSILIFCLSLEILSRSFIYLYGKIFWNSDIFCRSEDQVTSEFGYRKKKKS